MGGGFTPGCTGSRIRKTLMGGRSGVPGVGTAPRRGSQLGPAGAERWQPSDGARGIFCR